MGAGCRERESNVVGRERSAEEMMKRERGVEDSSAEERCVTPAVTDAHGVSDEPHSSVSEESPSER